MVAGLAGETGKTLVTLGLIKALRKRGFRVGPFKKGPDFIDAAWLGAAAGRPGRNLDTFLMPESANRESLAAAAEYADVSVIEGNRGLFDGFDAQGTHSTARLAKLTGTPVVLVVDATKVTRTVAAMVLGCRTLDPELELIGVVLNRVRTARQEAVIREAVIKDAGIPVLGAIPRLTEQHLPSRHLGLVTAIEHPDTEATLERLGDAIERNVDVSALLDAARTASWPLARPSGRRHADAEDARAAPTVRIGVLRDRAFSFYYPENLAALEHAGAELVAVSPLDDDELPDIDALYAGGGFPEVYARELSENHEFRSQLAARIAEGLPVWAECGGITYLAETLTHAGRAYPMVGALPVAVEHTERPRGHGYVEARVDTTNPFFDEGTELRGHEFHYSHVTTDVTTVDTILEVQRGVGLGGNRDGLINGAVVATYTHLHALGTPHWAERVVHVARSGAPKNGRARVRRSRALPVVASTRRATSKVATASERNSSTLRERAAQHAAERSKAAAALSHRKRARGGGAGLRQRVRAAVERADFDELQQLVAEESRAVRFLLALTYESDPALRRAAARGVALASHYHPRLVQNVIRRLIWAMNDESGTNSLTAPEVLQAIAEERAELLIPMIPDLVRLAADDDLREGLSVMLRCVASRCPGQIGRGLSESLSKRAKDGGFCGI